MTKVVLLCRVSTQRQDYARQVRELTEWCDTMKWEIDRVFSNKVSGARRNAERREIIELLDYIKTHHIDKVCVLEISRLGRNTLEALNIIRTLNENGVCLFIKNYNLETLTDGKVNPVASLICTILLEISQMERMTIRERMESGRRQYITTCRENDIKMGRPESYKKTDDRRREQYSKEISLLRKGLSLRQISVITGTSVSTIRKLYRFIPEINEQRIGITG